MRELNEYPLESYGAYLTRPYNPKQCAEQISSGYQFYQCGNKSGHGPKGLFCAKCAVRFSSGPPIYAVAVSSYRENEVLKVELLHKTDKFVTVRGLYDPADVSKCAIGKDWLFFPEPERAYAFMIQRALKTISSLKSKLAAEEGKLKELNRLHTLSIDGITNDIKTAD